MGDATEYQLALSPPWLLWEWGEAFELVLGLIKDAHLEGAAEAVAQRFIGACAADAIAKHGDARQILRAPGETLEQWRTRLKLAWDAWRRAGTGPGILLQLEPAGIVSATIVEGVSIDPSVPNSWGVWHLVVHEPHPFTPPITYGSGHTYGDGALYGFGAAHAIEYVRAVIRKWQPAHGLCTGVLIEFSTPATSVRLAVPWI